jgi:hypothetical protein
MRELALKTSTSDLTKKSTISKTKIKKLTHSNHQNTQFPSNFIKKYPNLTSKYIIFKRKNLKKNNPIQPKKSHFFQI